MFILTPGASFGYEPSQRFIDYLQNSIKQKISLIVCLDQLANSELAEGSLPSLYLHDSQGSAKSTIRDAFVYELRKQVEANPEVVSGLVEVGVTEQ